MCGHSNKQSDYFSHPRPTLLRRMYRPLASRLSGQRYVKTGKWAIVLGISPSVPITISPQEQRSGTCNRILGIQSLARGLPLSCSGRQNSCAICCLLAPRPCTESDQRDCFVHSYVGSLASHAAGTASAGLASVAAAKRHAAQRHLGQEACDCVCPFSGVIWKDLVDMG